MGLRCEACGKPWPDGFEVCPGDGGRLLEDPTGVAESLPQDLRPGTFVGEYRIDRKVGEGAMGTVYGATHPVIAKKVAIKVISRALGRDPQAVQRFILEARSANEIGHPNIVDVFSFGQLPDGRCYFVMELLRGESLYDRTARGRPSIAETLEILWQICLALEAAHQKGIVHRDLKPDNVFLVEAGGGRSQVKLLDFGLAKLVGAPAERHLTTAGAVMGTPNYISPEQARGGEVDGRTDLYALGIMAFEMVLGVLPFVGDNAFDTIHKHIHAAPPQPRALWPEIPPALERLLLGLLAKNPAERPTLAEVRTVLAELRPGASSVIPPIPDRPSEGDTGLWGPRAPRLRVSLPWMVAVGIVLGLAGVVVGTLLVRRRAGSLAVAAEAAAIQQRIAEGRLLAPAADSAYERVLAARRRFPERPAIDEAARQVAGALKQKALFELGQGHFDEVAQLLGRRAALAPADAEVSAALDKAQVGAAAVRAGMVPIGSFWIDRYEYPNVKGAVPLTRVDWAAAADLCQRAAKRLCTEEEWERACRGAEARSFPYGSRYEPGRCVAESSAQEPAAAGSHGRCTTDSGIADLSGNVAEWTASVFRPGAPQRVIRGGHWSQTGEKVSCQARDYFLPGLGGARTLGFRCCR